MSNIFHFSDMTNGNNTTFGTATHNHGPASNVGGDQTNNNASTNNNVNSHNSLSKNLVMNAATAATDDMGKQIVKKEA